MTFRCDCSLYRMGHLPRLPSLLFLLGLRKVCTLSGGVSPDSPDPISSITEKPSLPSASSTRWTFPLPLRSAYSPSSIGESPSGLPCSAWLTHDGLRTHLYSGGNDGSLSLTPRCQRPTPLPFWLRCISLFHLSGFTKLTMVHRSCPYPSLPRSYTKSGSQYTELPCRAFRCGRYLLATEAESVTLLRGSGE
jgi:hypothetical protein